MEYALELKNVAKHYNGFTLDKISFALPKGCIMGLVGENGAGKSTTIKLILDLIRKDGGQIRVLGHDSVGLASEVKEEIGVVLDESSFAENLSLNQVNNILRRIFKGWDEAQFRRYADVFRLPAQKAVKEYSRGMKMKLSIAVALSHGARLLLLDEATSGLDPVVRDEILDVFLEFIQDEDHSILMSSHIISDLEKACDYITILHEGKLILSEGKDTLLEGYGILKCSEEELRVIDKNAVKGLRRNRFGVEALVRRDAVRGNFLIDRAGVEEIMLFLVKTGNRG